MTRRNNQLKRLAVAARLAKAGARVLVVEKNGEEDVGGRVNERILDGRYRFETGPSLLLLPDAFRETFRDLGRDLSDFVNIRRVMPAYKVYFDDGTSVVLSDDAADMERQIEAIEPAQVDVAGRRGITDGADAECGVDAREHIKRWQ
ncbi:hypothetical protein JKP88DRAFT_289730 [Tribonema minus]|uniref:Amine oxidase domain-containing protein n=1 Tax=Tribonema minus TaxID=303371 RepID=A0A836CGU6_9STRA|nr:hypothetical protein JKP88DRAFT_289730 [Tribonema minus]